MNDITILLTGTGAPGAPGIIKCLRKNGERNIRIVGVDANENAGARDMVDLFYTVPMAKDDGFIPAVLEIAKREGVQIVLPIVTRELMKFAQNRALFEACGIKVSVMNAEPLAIVNNKANLLTKMAELGMQTPDFRVVHSVSELETACRELGYPERGICVKGAEGNGSRGVRLVDANKSKFDLFFNEKPNSMYISYSELIDTLSEQPQIPEMLAMELLPGEEYGVDVLAKDGEILYAAGRYNYSVLSSIPLGTILQYRQEPFAIAAEVCSKLHLSGGVNFDFKYDRNGNARLIEINPRLSATIVSYAAAGVNFPYLNLKQLLGEPLPKCELRYGTKMIRRYQEFFLDPYGQTIEW